MELRNHGDTDTRSVELRILGITNQRIHIHTENKISSYSAKKKAFPKEEKTRVFQGEMKPLMTEEEKKDAQVLELSYDFSCRIIRLYKFLNEGKLSKAD